MELSEFLAQLFPKRVAVSGNYRSAIRHMNSHATTTDGAL